MTEDDTGDNREPQPSDNIVIGIYHIAKGSKGSIRSFRRWLSKNPIKAAILLSPLTLVSTWALLNILGWLHFLFFGKLGKVQNDIKLTSFPLPVGLSLWILFLLLFGMAGYFSIKIGELRDEME